MHTNAYKGRGGSKHKRREECLRFFVKVLVFILYILKNEVYKTTKSYPFLNIKWEVGPKESS